MRNDLPWPRPHKYWRTSRLKSYAVRYCVCFWSLSCGFGSFREFVAKVIDPGSHYEPRLAFERPRRRS